MTVIKNEGYTEERRLIGLHQEDVFASLMEYNDVQLESLSKTDPFCSVDFRLKNTNTYIELKYRQTKQDAFDNLYLDTTKISRWKRELPNKTIYIAFGFIDKQYCFIKYNEELFDSFKTRYLDLYKMTNLLIPTNKCMDLQQFLKELKRPSPIIDCLCEDFDNIHL